MSTTDGYHHDLSDLAGTVVKAERVDSAVRLTYADGRSFTLLGDGYDGLWQYVVVSEDEQARDLGVD